MSRYLAALQAPWWTAMMSPSMIMDYIELVRLSYCSNFGEAAFECICNARLLMSRCLAVLQARCCITFSYMVSPLMYCFEPHTTAYDANFTRIKQATKLCARNLSKQPILYVMGSSRYSIAAVDTAAVICNCWHCSRATPFIKPQKRSHLSLRYEPASVELARLQVDGRKCNSVQLAQVQLQSTTYRCEVT